MVGYVSPANASEWAVSAMRFEMVDHHLPIDTYADVAVLIWHAGGVLLLKGNSEDQWNRDDTCRLCSIPTSPVWTNLESTAFLANTWCLLLAQMLLTPNILGVFCLFIIGMGPYLKKQEHQAAWEVIGASLFREPDLDTHRQGILRLLHDPWTTYLNSIDWFQDPVYADYHSVPGQRFALAAFA